jgi:hypothetical protein
MHGAPDESAQVTVTLISAPRADVTSMLLRLHGLSTRTPGRGTADARLRDRRDSRTALTVGI